MKSSFKRLCKVIVLAAMSGVLPGEGWSQISSENSDRHFITNARAAAMADAIVSDATDISSMYWNPASIVFLQERSVVVNYSLERIRGRDDMMNENVAVALMNRDDLAFGIGATYSHVGHVGNDSPISGYSFNQGSLDLAAAMALSRFFSAGIISTVRYGRVPSRSATTLSAGLGLMYYPSSVISYALSFQGVGDGMEYSFDSSEERTILTRGSLTQSMQVGITSRFGGEEGRPTIVLTAADQKIFGKNGFIYKGGVEAWVARFLALRLGYWVGPESIAARYGGGIRAGQWRLDYGVSTTELEPRFHQVSVSYCFPSHLSRR